MQTHYKPALYDGSDKLYAPGLSRSKRTFSWNAPAKYKKAGYEPARVNLELPGTIDDEHRYERARLCRQYTRKMLEWWEQQDESAVDFGTWAYLIRRYRSDAFSPYADVKQNTRAGYDYTLDIWDSAIGHLKIQAMTFEQIKQIEQTMLSKGRSHSHVRRMFTMMRGLVSYGAKIKETRETCRDVKLTLSEMRFKMPVSRSVHATADQVQAIVEAADAAGFETWATGVLTQWEFMLRAVDVRGQWFEDNGKGGIVRNGRRWQDGLTWEMFSPDLSSFSKTISKTAKSMPEPYTFDLTAVPYLRDRIARMRPQSPVGPVFVSREGLPYDQTAWSRVWRRFAREAGVPDEVKVMDVRSGAITEAESAGASGFALRDAAQHKQITTTGGYARGRDANTAKVVELRQKARKLTA